MSTPEISDALTRIRPARQRAVEWITQRVDDDGRPAGSDVRNCWWRAPWALAVAGAPDVAAAVLGWVEREALTDEGDLKPGRFGGVGGEGSYNSPAGGSSAYLLSPLAIGAHLVGRYDTARVVMDRLEHWIDPTTGGVYDRADYAADPIQDLLKTGQVGVAALVTGRRATADGVARWLRHAWDVQPELPHRLFTYLRDGQPVTDLDQNEAWGSVADFREPRQPYYLPGIAGAFLAGYGEQTGDRAAIELSAAYLDLNKQGTDAQFTDTASVQICKFGWGIAALHQAAPESGQLPWLLRMADWFVDRQRVDGAWAPSGFLNDSEPSDLDLYWKTAEHLMELCYIEFALAGTHQEGLSDVTSDLR